MAPIKLTVTDPVLAADPLVQRWVAMAEAVSETRQMTDFNSKAWQFNTPEAPKPDLATPQEMRAELERVGHRDVLVRRVDDMARYTGLSGEDKYVVLAYYALIERAHYLKLAIKRCNTTLYPPVVVDGAKK